MGRFDHVAPEPPSEPSGGPGAGSAPAGEPEFGFDHFYGEARRAHERGRFEIALRYYGRALERDRERPEGWLGQVRALMDMGQPEEAMTWLEQATRVIGEGPALLALRSLAAARSGEPDDALAWSDRAMRAGMDDPEVWLARAEVLYLQGQDKLAGHTLDKALERASLDTAADDAGAASTASRAEILRRCGEIALDAGDLTRARTWLTRAERAAPDNPLVAMRLGVLWERSGDLARAEVELSRALTLEPGLESARLARDDLQNRGPFDRFVSWLKRTRNG